ncbi:hypothetical protein DFA_00981 [Cavenderia fasciculata]|uniref:Uncharacterized protein n=1 Tax=Cavenderia fasciculata TaxID=261658 RepID=F4PUT7_CACFS|nr:uncharacterized protein DFA_00981 [Cavenderia fasciculata]EGG21106.1 hypothetical protein DFA_00981 [Cavenderia fasciculata]|eukprot:XP_004358956.1 hypothetical protein DFA_00981 [Cavenderia fasciculata]
MSKRRRSSSTRQEDEKKKHRILTLADRSIRICTCVNAHELRDALSSHYSLHTVSVYSKLIKNHWIDKEDMCPMHRAKVERGLLPSYNFEQGLRPEYRVCRFIVDDSKSWRRSLSRVSKRVFSFVSTSLYTDITIRPSRDTWEHISNNYCLLKKATTLTVLPAVRLVFFPAVTDQIHHLAANNLYSSVEKIHLLEEVADLDKMACAMPRLKSMVQHCELSEFTITKWLTNFKNLTSINLLNSKLIGFDVDQLPSMIKADSQLRKILLPKYFNWNTLDVAVKQRLSIISMRSESPSHKSTINYAEIQQQDFPKLKHVHLVQILSDTNRVVWDQLVLPESVVKLTLCTPPPNVNPFTRNKHIRTVRFKNSKTPNYSDIPIMTIHLLLSKKALLFGQTNLSKIIIDTPVDVVDTDIIQFKEMGYRFIGSTPSSNDQYR